MLRPVCLSRFIRGFIQVLQFACCPNRGVVRLYFTPTDCPCPTLQPCQRVATVARPSSRPALFAIAFAIACSWWVYALRSFVARNSCAYVAIAAIAAVCVCFNPLPTNKAGRIAAVLVELQQSHERQRKADEDKRKAVLEAFGNQSAVSIPSAVLDALASPDSVNAMQPMQDFLQQVAKIPGGLLPLGQGRKAEYVKKRGFEKDDENLGTIGVIPDMAF